MWYRGKLKIEFLKKKNTNIENWNKIKRKYQYWQKHFAASAAAAAYDDSDTSLG